MLIELLPVLTAIDVPEISPDFSAPFMAPLLRIVSWVLAGAMAVTIVLLIVAAVGVGTKGLGSSKYQEWAGSSILHIIGAIAILGSISGIFAFFVGFDLGF